MKKIIYVLTIEYDPDSDSIETMKEEIIEDIVWMRAARWIYLLSLQVMN